MSHVCLTRVFIFLLILSGLIGFWQTNNIRHYTGMVDIRNRVVGARLMHDGISPYFYNWYPGEPLNMSLTWMCLISAKGASAATAYQMTQWMAAGVFVIAFNKKIPRQLIFFFLGGII